MALRLALIHKDDKVVAELEPKAFKELFMHFMKKTKDPEKAFSKVEKALKDKVLYL